MPEVQPQPQFKVFYGKGRHGPTFAFPAVSIHRGGTLHFNQAAHEQMGRPVAMELSFDETLKIVGLRPLQEVLDHAYPLAKHGTSAAYTMNAIAFCKACGLDLTQARRYRTVRYGEVFGLDLTAPVAVTSAPESQRSQPPGIRTRGK